MMRALVLEDYGRMEVQDAPPPTVGASDLLLRVAYAGICGTDVHGFSGGNGRRQPGQIMGHEASGRVVAAGARASGPRVGAEVTFTPLLACGTCAECRAGAEQRCVDRAVLGVVPERAAAFADLVAVPASRVREIPAGLGLKRAALVEPLAVGLHAVRRGGDVSGRDLLIVGGGPIGQAAVLAAQAGGARRIVVSDPVASRRAVCQGLGVETVDPSATSVAEGMTAGGGRGADIVIDAVGVSASIRDGLAASAPGATIVLVGMGSPRLELDAYPIVTDERTIVGSYCYSDASFDDALQLAAASADALDGLVSDVVSLDQAPEAFLRLAGSDPVGGKVLIRMEGGS